MGDGYITMTLALAELRQENKRLQRVITQFANAVDKQAQNIPAPNSVTPVLMQLGVQARAMLNPSAEGTKASPRPCYICGHERGEHIDGRCPSASDIRTEDGNGPA
jgi:hypothetical protein